MYTININKYILNFIDRNKTNGTGNKLDIMIVLRYNYINSKPIKDNVTSLTNEYRVQETCTTISIMVVRLNRFHTSL